MVADNKMTKSVGEHWTCSELARSGWAPALTRDGLERTDILAVATHLPERPTIDVQVKAANETAGVTSWPLGYADKMEARSDREWFVLVLIPRARNGQVRGYVVPRTHVTAASWIAHMDWLTKPDVPVGRRNAPVSRSRVRRQVWGGYESRWDLLDVPTPQVPVLLPNWMRERAFEERVGLPPVHPWTAELPAGWL